MEIADKRGEGCHVQEYKYKSWDLVLINICTTPSFSELSQQRFAFQFILVTGRNTRLKSTEMI